MRLLLRMHNLPGGKVCYQGLVQTERAVIVG